MTTIIDTKENELLVHGDLIANVHMRYLESHFDQRGSFTEVFSAEWEGALNPKQWSLVESEPGACRGMHVHRHHDECYLLISGHGYLGLHDIRHGSPTEGTSMMLELRSERPCLVSFTRGVLHGWYFAARSTHLQGVSRTYNDYHPDDNLGCDWSDPDLNLPWPSNCELISERARGFPRLRELMTRILIPYSG